MAVLAHRKTAVVAALSLSVIGAAPARAQPDQLRLHLGYDGSLYLKVLDLEVDQTLDGKSFQSSVHLKTSGILSLLHKINVHAESQGRIERDTAVPKSFTYMNADGRKNRRVTATWTGGDVAIQSQPQFPSLGDPPASREQKLEAADPLTILTRVTMAPSGERPCEGVHHFFDGKQRYDVAFSYRGTVQPDARERLLGITDAVHCNLAFHEVAGFKKKPPEQRTQGLKRDVTVTLGRLGVQGPWVVSSLRADTVLGAAHIDLVNAQVTGPVAVLARNAAHAESLARR